MLISSVLRDLLSGEIYPIPALKDQFFGAVPIHYARLLAAGQVPQLEGFKGETFVKHWRTEVTKLIPDVCSRAGEQGLLQAVATAAINDHFQPPFYPGRTVTANVAVLSENRIVTSYPSVGI